MILQMIFSRKALCVTLLALSFFSVSCVASESQSSKNNLEVVEVKNAEAKLIQISKEQLKSAGEDPLAFDYVVNKMSNSWEVYCKPKNSAQLGGDVTVFFDARGELQKVLRGQ